MTTYITRRFIQAVIVIIIVSLLVFFVIRFLPGDPILLYLAQKDVQVLTQQQIDVVRHNFGLDRPLMIQYFNWVSGILQGNFGTSIFYHEDVGNLLAKRLPVTLHLGLSAFVLSGILGILTGLLAAIRRGRWPETVVTLFANLGITVPVFWLGILMIYVIGLKLGWLPIYGYTSPFTDLWTSFKQAIMPVLCLSVFALASISRQTRSSILEVVRQDYIRTAWAKGLRERIIIIRHVLKNGLIPVITLQGVQFSHIVGGSVLIETVFSIPGMGRMLVEAVMSKDYMVVQGGIFVLSVMVVFTNLLVDISYGFLDPRIRYG
jgi:peptide/nickel transport system permease protein